MSVFTDRPALAASALILVLCGGNASQARSRLAPAGLVMKMRSEWRGAYGGPVPDDAALTMMTVPLTGLGATNASFMRHQRPSTVMLASSVHRRRMNTENSSAIS